VRSIFRDRLTYANVMATIAIFIALGGTSYGVVTLNRNSVTSQHIRPGAVKRTDLGRNSVVAAKVADGSLLAKDFASGALPQGSTGPQGVQGPKGDTGTVDTSGFYTKTGSDARFLGIAATAADSELLDGRNSLDFVRDFQTIETETQMALAAGASHTQVANCPAEKEALGGGGYNAQDNVNVVLRASRSLWASNPRGWTVTFKNIGTVATGNLQLRANVICANV
jgi:hypothetical protein